MLSPEFLENAKLFFFLFSLDCYDLIELHIKIIFLNFLSEVLPQWKFLR